MSVLRRRGSAWAGRPWKPACVGVLAVLAACSDATSPGAETPELALAAGGPTELTAEVASEVALVVRVEDPAGDGYPGATVSWSAAAGTLVSGPTTTSGSGGYAGAVWELGGAAGVQTVSASVTAQGATSEVTFSATALPGPGATAELIADSILLSARGETAFLGPTLHDAYGNQTTDGTVVWSSRDTLVATVTAEGLVTGRGEGSSYLIASVDDPSDSLLVTVSYRGAITVTFDDGFISAYTNAFPVFQEFDLVGNLAVNPAQVTFPAYVNPTQIDEMYAGGWSIVSHSMTHDSLPSLTVGELDYELRASREWIEARGYAGANVFIVPYHAWGTRERDAIGTYYTAARGTSATAFSPDSLVAWRPSNPYDLTGIEAENLPYTTVDGRDMLRDLLQRTVDEGAFVDVFFHDLPAGNVDAFRATLAVVDEFSDRVLPYRELYPRFARSVF